MRKNIPILLNSGSSIRVSDRRMHGKDSHLSVQLTVESKTIEVICSKEAVNRGGLLRYFSYAVEAINRQEEKKYEKLRVLSEKKGWVLPERGKASLSVRDNNCITLYNHLRTGLAAQ